MKGGTDKRPAEINGGKRTFGVRKCSCRTEGKEGRSNAEAREKRFIAGRCSVAERGKVEGKEGDCLT